MLSHHWRVLSGVLRAQGQAEGSYPGSALSEPRPTHRSQDAQGRCPGAGHPRGAAATSYLPDLVRTIMAPLQHLKEASTAPTAAASVGSLVMGARRRSSSNNCKW